MRVATGWVVAAVLAASAAPAAADWQYTQWGMTPGEVRAASDGAARDNPDRALDAGGLRAQLVAPYRGVSLPFTAAFLFDDADRLKTVTLNPSGGDACPAMVRALLANHGEPGKRADMGEATTMRWDDAENDNLVVYLNLGGGRCTIQYSRLPPTRPSGKGL